MIADITTNLNSPCGSVQNKGTAYIEFIGIAIIFSINPSGGLPIFSHTQLD